jgi:LPS export ABC transporter permease LptF/LPS export ABC transporter permease LptG
MAEAAGGARAAAGAGALTMGILSRAVFREIFSSAFLGTVLFTFVLFLQRAGKSFELLVRSSASFSTVAYLFGLLLPFTLIYTLPVGALVGILIALSRMSSDGEIVGMRAAGVPSRRIIVPVMGVAVFFTLITAACSLWLTPWSIRQTYRVLNRLAAEELTAEVQPRVFEEQFPNTVLYVGDVIPGPVEIWRNVFMADLRAPSEPSGGQAEGEGPRITLAREAIAAPDVKNNRIQLHLIDASTHQATKDPQVYVSTSFPSGDQALQAARPNEVRASKPFTEMDTVPLARQARHSRDAAIELHQRLALPLACVLLALVGIPLGVSSRKGGKSAAFVVTVFLAFLYYMALISLISLAHQGTVPVAPAIWAPNILFAIVGLIMLARLERPGDRDLVDSAKALLQSLWRPLRGRLRAPAHGAIGGRLGRFHVLPQILDMYILSSFLFYFVLLLASFVFMTHVYTFFELLGDIFKNKIPISRVLTYLFFLTPKLIYDSTPVSVLVGVLVAFGIMAKHNEVTAFKATGVSLYRLAVPVLIASFVLSAGLFTFDYSSILPEANRRQDALRDEIKGRAPQTYLRPDRKWIKGEGPRIYYYKYFDPHAAVMAGVNVYEFDMHPFRLRRHIEAARARWEPEVGTWIFENGWSRDMKSRVESTGQTFQATTFPELNEPPGYFLKEVIQYKQMNSTQLAAYIHELGQSGFDTVHLRVQLQKKFSVPLFAFIMALISIPFAFLTGSRGAMAGVGVSLGIAVAYWAVGQLFEQIGNVNQLPPALAAWAPDALFALAGTYLLMRLRT